MNKRELKKILDDHIVVPEFKLFLTKDVEYIYERTTNFYTDAINIRAFFKNGYVTIGSIHYCERSFHAFREIVQPAIEKQGDGLNSYPTLVYFSKENIHINHHYLEETEQRMAGYYSTDYSKPEEVIAKMPMIQQIIVEDLLPCLNYFKDLKVFYEAIENFGFHERKQFLGGRLDMLARLWLWAYFKNPNFYSLLEAVKKVQYNKAKKDEFDPEQIDVMIYNALPEIFDKFEQIWKDKPEVQDVIHYESDGILDYEPNPEALKLKMQKLYIDAGITTEDLKPIFDSEAYPNLRNRQIEELWLKEKKRVQERKTI